MRQPGGVGTIKGRRKDSVSDIRFRTDSMPTERGWTSYRDLFPHLPLVLDVGEASRIFMVQMDPPLSAAYPRPPDNDDRFQDQLRSGFINTMDVEASGHRLTSFPVPLRPYM